MTEVQVELYPGEQLLWTGATTRFPLFTRSDAVLIPFIMLWFAIVIFMASGSILRGGPVFPKLISGLFVVFGLYAVFGRFVVRWLTLRSTVYAVTDRRVVVTSSVFGSRREQSSYLRDLPPPIVLGNEGPAATIRFGDSNLVEDLRNQGVIGWLPAKNQILPVLVEVTDARTVRDLIANAQARPY